MEYAIIRIRQISASLPPMVTQGAQNSVLSSRWLLWA